MIDFKVGKTFKNNEGRKFLVTSISPAGKALENGEKILSYVRKSDYTHDVVYGVEVKEAKKKIATPQVPALEGMKPLEMKVIKHKLQNGVTRFELKF